MTRPAVPVEFMEANHKSLRTSKKELAVRREMQDQHSIGSACIFKPNKQVESNSEALEKFNEITTLYVSANATFVTSADNDLINRYCLLYAEYVDLVNMTERLKYKACSDSSEDVDIYLKSDKAVNNKALLLLKLGSSLYLDPKSRATIAQMTIKHTEKIRSLNNKNTNNDDDLF